MMDTGGHYPRAIPLLLRLAVDMDGDAKEPSIVHELVPLPLLFFYLLKRKPAPAPAAVLGPLGQTELNPDRNGSVIDPKRATLSPIYIQPTRPNRRINRSRIMPPNKVQPQGSLLLPVQRRARRTP